MGALIHPPGVRNNNAEGERYGVFIRLYKQRSRKKKIKNLAKLIKNEIN